MPLYGRQPIELYAYRWPGSRGWGVWWGSCSMGERYKVTISFARFQVSLVLGRIRA